MIDPELREELLLHLLSAFLVGYWFYKKAIWSYPI